MRLKYLFMLVSTGIAFILIQIASRAQSGTEPRLIHDACTGNCVVDAYFLHANKGDSSARETYHGWYNSFYSLTECNDTSWMNEFSFILDVIGDIVGAPGAPTLQCWQGVMAQASACSKSCSEYFIRDAKFAPNARLTLDGGVPGVVEATIDNQVNLGKVPELQPNAYTRRFHLLTTLQREGGSAVLVNDTEMPSLSFPNWITRGGYSDCITAYGAEDQRCKLIELLPAPSVVSWSVEFLDGVFYDLTSQVKNLSNASGSFSQDGFIRLLSNGDSLTIKRGPYAGFAWVKTYNLTRRTHTQQLIPWDASQRDVQIANTECNTPLSTCWITGDRTESDTYVFALSGPIEKRLPGAYTVQVAADIAHEKDFSDNRASYSYDAAQAGTQQEESQEEQGSQGTGIRVSDLPIIDLPGPGSYPNNTPEGMPGVLYRLRVPEGVRFQFLRLVATDGGQFSLFTRRGSIPVPDYPVIREDYNCWAQADAGYSGGCPFTNPYPDAYYIFVNRLQGSAYRLEVEWRTTPLQNEQESQNEQENQKPENLFSEVEANDSRATANAWDMQQPFTGQITRNGDRDYIFLDINQTGIYTFSLTKVGPQLRAKMSLLRASSGNYLDSSKASVKGESISLSFDASAGEQYDLIIEAITMTAGAVNQPYQLSLTGFVPDPHESNDDRNTATFWDLTQSPMQGYFWDKTTGRSDYFRFVAPQTSPGTPVTFELTNPAQNMRIRMTLINSIGLFQANTPYSEPGQPLVFSKVLEANKEYYLKLECLDLKTSLQPYTLSATYTPGSAQTETQANARPVRLHGLVFRQGSLIPLPINGVSVYAEVAGQPAVFLGKTGVVGTYVKTINMVDGQSVRIWAVKEGFTFQPLEEVWSPDARHRSHRTVFTVVGAQLTQATLTPTAVRTTTPPPPLIQTALATPRPTQVRTATPFASPTPTQTARATLQPTQASTATPRQATATATSPAAQTTTVITGKVWRLFPRSGPAGVGAARVILTVNGVDRPAVMSMIDGSYSISAPNLQPGDQLKLRAENPGESFEPISYQWRAEAGVTQWSYDFYSYQGTITPPARDDQNRVFGRVIDSQGRGVAGAYLVVQMGTSDALQRIGPTDANGNYSAFVRLPNRVMATIWVEQTGYLPSRVQFFHAYAPENRVINFFQQPASMK